MADDRADLLRRFDAVVSDVDVHDWQALIGELHSLRDPEAEPPERPRLRRPGFTEPVVLRLRVELRRTEPPIRRLLDVRGTITLSVLHLVLQAAFGWSGARPYRFSIGGGPWDDHSELFLGPVHPEEGEVAGTPAEAVRLDETLQEPGDVLHYVYDFVEPWQITVRLQELQPAGPDTPTAVCVAGERAAPPENCPGVTDAQELAEVIADPARFDVETVNEALRDPLFLLREAGIHPPALELVARLRSSPVGADLMRRLALLQQPAGRPSPDDLAACLRAHRWLLDLAADGGIELTSAGYLKPALVAEAALVLPAMNDWVGRLNRENQCRPLLKFRMSLQSEGLLRKSRGRLVATKVGKSVRRDPRALFDHLAGRLAPDGGLRFTSQAGLLALIYISTSPDGRIPEEEFETGLQHLGWRLPPGVPMRAVSELRHRGGVLTILDHIADAPQPHGDTAHSGVAIAMARAALLPEH